MGKLITLVFSYEPREIRCPGCEEIVTAAEFNGEAEECNYCHESADPSECRCEACHDRLVMAADFMED